MRCARVDLHSSLGHPGNAGADRVPVGSLGPNPLSAAHGQILRPPRRRVRKPQRTAPRVGPIARPTPGRGQRSSSSRFGGLGRGLAVSHLHRHPFTRKFSHLCHLYRGRAPGTPAAGAAGHRCLGLTVIVAPVGPFPDPAAPSPRRGLASPRVSFLRASATWQRLSFESLVIVRPTGVIHPARHSRLGTSCALGPHSCHHLLIAAFTVFRLHRFDFLIC